MTDTFRKIEVETRDDNDDTLTIYTKRRKDGVLTEKFSKKKRDGKKVLSSVYGTAIDQKGWDIKTDGGEPVSEDYKKYNIGKNIFNDFKFIDVNDGAIGGAVGGGACVFTYVGYVVVLLLIWFACEYYLVYGKLQVIDSEAEIYNESEPTVLHDRPDMSFSAIYPDAISQMGSRVGLSI